MTVTTYSVFSADRTWSEWLRMPVVEKALPNLDPRTFQQADWYVGPGRFLVLIHFSDCLTDVDQEAAAALEENWQALPDELRDRVWWLVYSGSGFWNLASAKSNVHYFRSPISRTAVSEDEKSCFRRFLKALDSNAKIDATIWSSLYPTDNVAAATLLALLAAETWTDIRPSVDRLLDEDPPENLAIAHRQYAARVKQQSPQTPKPTLAHWIRALNQGDYSAVRAQLIEVLGAVPD